MRHLLWNSNSANSYFDNWDCCDTCCTKSLCFITLAPVYLTLFLTFAAVTPLSTRNYRLIAWRSVMVRTFCVDIRIIQKSLRTEIKLIPGIVCAQNPSVHRNFAQDVSASILVTTTVQCELWIAMVSYLSFMVL